MPAPLFNTIKERYESLVVKQVGCWFFKMLNDNGYGRFPFKGKRYYAHRVSWELRCGPIPEDKHVLHTCDNPICSNPEHLFLGYDHDNIRDMINKGRSNPCKGIDTHTAKLTEDQVYEIRGLLAAGASHRNIAEDYNVAKSTITRISNGTGWSHL